ncbi:MAG: alpha/beta hydrolase [Rhodospirillales bacterium]|nr:alpha/beta hydrolase [Rhodospirillales bacterium]
MAATLAPDAAFGFAIDTLNRLSPRRGVMLHSAAYAPGPRGTVDLYWPRGVAEPPTVLFFYGGGWEAGERAMYRFVGSALAACGLACAIPDYRLYPEVRFPDFMEDAAAALAWIATRRGVRAERLFVMGHSAGAHIATLLALDPRYRERAGAPAPRGVIGLAGPYDFLPLKSPVLRDIFGPEADWGRSQPIRFAHRAAPPMLLAAGARDRTVLAGNTHRLAAALRAHGVAVTQRIYPLLGHRALIGGFARVLAPFLPVRRAVLDFVGSLT